MTGRDLQPAGLRAISHPITSKAEASIIISSQRWNSKETLKKSSSLLYNHLGTQNLVVLFHMYIWHQFLGSYSSKAPILPPIIWIVIMLQLRFKQPYPTSPPCWINSFIYVSVFKVNKDVTDKRGGINSSTPEEIKNSNCLSWYYWHPGQCPLCNRSTGNTPIILFYWSFILKISLS